MSKILDPRLSAAILVARTTQIASRTLRRGGGSTIPGVAARRVDPDVFKKLSRELARGSIAITGTNGKTTTTRMVNEILSAAGIRAVNNSTGANLITGITSAAVSNSSLFGHMTSEVGIFEVDEASVPRVAAEADLSILAVLNLFRDQLDRYGELAYTGKVIASAFLDLPQNGAVVLNTDDPLVASLGASSKRAVFFGVEDSTLNTGTLQHVADSKDCPVCGTLLSYSAVYFGHIGTYRCPNCAFTRPEPRYRVTRVRMDGPRGASFLLTTPEGEYEAGIGLPGLYNVYNALAAAAVSCEAGVETQIVVRALREFEGAFGRVERVKAGEKEVFLLLIKNPVGFNEILRTFVASPTEKNGADTARHVLIAINDNYADGRDVSWLWDVDFEMLKSAGTNARFYVSGIRAEDMTVRLKYAELPVTSVQAGRKEALMAALDATPAGETLYVLPTYTAMLELRQTLSDLGYTHPFWED